MINKFIFKSDEAFSLNLPPLFIDSTVSGVVDWGDGTTTDYIHGYNSHSYVRGGTYTVIFATTDDCTKIGNGFCASNSFLISAELSEEITQIGGGTFYYAPNLTELNIPYGAIVENASCAGSGLKVVCFGRYKKCSTISLESCGPQAFLGCANLKSIKFYTDDTSLQGTSIDDYFITSTDEDRNNTYITVNYLATYVPFVITDIPSTNYIVVYDMCETNFTHNGLRILSPTSCKIKEQKNGLYELTLEHPVDDDGTWKSLRYFNIIKANGQLFRIYKKTTSLNTNGLASVTVYAKHIFYDLADRLVKSCDISNLDGQSALNHIFNSIFDNNQDGLLEYDFRYFSDIQNIASDCSYSMISPVACLIGEDNCFVNRLGGELYRDNFYFSICSVREGSVQNAFSIVHGMNMLSIKEDADVSELLTYLHTEDNYCNQNDISYSSSAVFYPHIISKGKIFNYNECNSSALAQDMSDYFNQYCEPKISYTVKFANLHNAELYKDFINLKNYNVGDSGTIYSEDLGISTTQTIIEREYDVLNDEVTSITLGNFQHSLVRRERFANTITRADNIISRVASPYRIRQVSSEEELRSLAEQGKLEKNVTYADMSGDDTV